MTLGAVALPGHPVMNGISTFDGGSGSWHEAAGLAPGATLIASWTDALPLVSEMPGAAGGIVGLNFYPPSSDARADFWDATTDGAILMGNALEYVSRYNGTYLVSNDPAETPDFADLGAAFDALEAKGVNGPVILEVSEGLAAYGSAASYRLGDVAVVGVSATNTITIRPQAGENPVIGGSGALAPFISATGTILIDATSYVTIQGLEITGGTDFGIALYAQTGSMTEITIDGCVIHGTGGNGLWMWENGQSITNLRITNNFIYDCAINGSAIDTNNGGAGLIGFWNIQAGTVVQHNTLLLNNANPGPGGAFTNSGGGAGSTLDISYNVFRIVTPGYSYYDHDFFGGRRIATADRNVYFGGTPPFEIMSAGATTFADWQLAGFDINGLELDPMLVNTATGSEDLHVQAGSPAADLAVGSSVVVDIDGDVRPFGAAADSGADETVPEIDVQRPSGTSIADGGNDALGNVVVGTVTPFTYTIENAGIAPLSLTGAPLVSATANANCTVNVSTQPTTPVAAGGTTTFVVEVTVTAVGAFDFDISIDNDDADENPYNFNVAGTGIGPEIDVQRPAGTSIADGGNDALGNVAIGAPATFTYTIENTGLVDLDLTGAPLVSATANTNCTVNVTTQPTTPVALGGGTTTFIVEVTVTAAGAFDFNISIANNDADENPYNFNVAGTGVIAPEIDIQRPVGTSIPSAGTDAIGSRTTGQAVPITYTIDNQGTGALTLTGVAPDYVALSVLTNCTASVTTQPTTPIAAGNSVTFVVSVTPTADGAFSVVVTILNDDADEGTYTFTISGTGTAPAAASGCCGVTDQAGSRGNFALTFALAIVLMTLYFVRRRFFA